MFGSILMLLSWLTVIGTKTAIIITTPPQTIITPLFILDLLAGKAGWEAGNTMWPLVCLLSMSAHSLGIWSTCCYTHLISNQSTNVLRWPLESDVGWLQLIKRLSVEIPSSDDESAKSISVFGICVCFLITGGLTSVSVKMRAAIKVLLQIYQN